MAILNKSKIRSDVMASFEKMQAESAQAFGEFLQKDENKAVNFQDIIKRNLEGNEYFFKNKGVDDHLRNLLSYDERCFLARMFRFGSDYTARINQERKSVTQGVEIKEADINGIPAEWRIVPETHPDRVLLFFHGGGCVIGSVLDHRPLSISMAKELKLKTLSIDYRLAPENPYPAPLEDCVAAYKWLLSNGTKPEDIIIAGPSAGGHLTLTTLLYLRDNNLPLPAGAILLSPVTDFTMTDELLYKNSETDPILSEIGLFWTFLSYLGEADPADPYISALFADLEGLPPLLFQVSTCEMLYNDTARFVEKAEKAGVDVTMQKWDDMLHAFQLFNVGELTEVQDALNKMKQFAEQVFQ